jgi:hypothetical protein
LRWQTLVPTLAAAALPLLLVWLNDAPRQHGSTRAKGPSRIGFYVKHGEHVRPGKPGEHVVPGDRLRFTYSTSEHARLTVVGLDARGQASLYFSGPVTGGQNIALDSAVELDATLGVEHIHALFCSTPIDTQAVLRELEQRAGSLSPRAGCEHQLVHIVKERGP